MPDEPPGPLPTTRDTILRSRPSTDSVRKVSVPGAVGSTQYLELLARGASAVEFEAPVLAARASGADADALEELERAKTLALQVRGLFESRRRREAELSALFETASDLAALNGVDAVLRAIVRRARQLLQSDVGYLSLNDDEVGDTYMRVTDGATSAAFRKVRLPMGAGLGGLVAQTATPYATPSYFEDERFKHTETIDSAVHDEGLVSILGVPLHLGRRVIGVLYAANRTVRPFTRDEVALLESLAAHAAIAIDNARLLTETQVALEELETTSELLRTHTASVERAADAHDRLAALVLHGGGVEDVAREVREVLGGEVVVLNPDQGLLAWTDDTQPPTGDEVDLAGLAASTSRTVDRDGLCATPVVAGADHLGALILRRGEALDEADRRILERAALVTALLLLFQRSVSEAEGRVRGEFLEDLLSAVDRDPQDLRDRARLLGADLERPFAIVVAHVDGDRARVSQAASFLASVNHGFSAIHDGRLVLMLPDLEPGSAAKIVSDSISPSMEGPLTAGVAGPANGTAAIVAAHAEARRVLDSLLALGRTGEVAETSDMGFVGLLLGERQEVAPFIESVIGPVIQYDAQRGTHLVGTLEAYFDSGGNIARTRIDLHVHVNTVTQRLARITRLLGEEWHEPERQLEVQLALRLHRLLRGKACR